MIVRIAITLLAIVSCGPGPDPIATEPPVVVAAHDNRASSLVAAVDHIVAIEVLAAADRRPLGACDPALLEPVKVAIRSGVREGLTATPPAWPIVIRIVLDRGEPFVAHFVGHDRLRLCPGDPWRDCVADPETGALDRDAAEVGVPFELFEDIARIVGEPPRKEYRTPETSPSPL